MNQHWVKIQRQIQRASRFLAEGDFEEAVNNTWAAAENTINLLRRLRGEGETWDHQQKVATARRFFAEGLFSRDYSTAMRVLGKLRRQATYLSDSDAMDSTEVRSLLDETRAMLDEASLIIGGR